LEGVFIDEKKEKSSQLRSTILPNTRVPYDNPAPQFRLGSHME